MKDEKRCFVAMPIKREGTPDHAHFKALYDQVLKPTLEAGGYSVTRADEIKHGGAITRDIILPLASADLVLVDLTDLNPNVFYELGVRHSLRARGTVMIVDLSRTETIPFDLGAYRVIQFRGELTGIGKLVKELEDFLKHSDREQAVQDRDNPVHDWIPALPPNAMASAVGSAEGALRDDLKRAQEVLRRYEKAYGSLSPGFDRREGSPLSTVMLLSSQAEEGSLPSDLLAQAQRAAKEFNAAAFLDVVRRIMEKGGLVSEEQFHMLAGFAARLDIPGLVGAVYDYAIEMHPRSTRLTQGRLAHHCHSSDPALRERARQELVRRSGVIVNEDGHVTVPKVFERDAQHLVGLALDGYHRDDLHQQALAITQAIVAAFVDRSALLRNHARALEKVGRLEEALDYHRRSLWCPDVSDSAAIWLGSELHNRRRYVDAVEAYALGCILDPDDATNFAHVAEDLVYALQEAAGLNPGARALPTEITGETVLLALAAGLSCPGLDAGDMERLTRTASRAEIDLDHAGRRKLTRGERLTAAGELYGLLKSDLTLPPSS